MSIITALMGIQNALKSPKDQNAGRYRYRNIEDINQAVKPLAASFNCAVIYTDRFEDGFCFSTCKLIADDGEISAEGFAAVNRQPKGMSVEQACGAASSYARKYAACGLFAIDSSENDPDRTNATVPQVDSKTDVDLQMVNAKKRLWDAVYRWSELNGVDPKAEAESVKQRDDYRETRAYFNKVAEEYEKKCTSNASTNFGEKSQG